MSDLSYPIGEFRLPGTLTPEERRAAVDAIAAAPSRLHDAVAGLSDAQLDTPYRSGGWSVRQLVHHIADSHVNGYVRLKLALSEDVPTIRPYDQVEWARLPDSEAPIELSLDIIEAIHRRWVLLWKHVSGDQWSRPFHHPESGEMRVDELAALYAWHGEHHTAHITALREREGW